jgi:hypothetical protein
MAAEDDGDAGRSRPRQPAKKASKRSASKRSASKRSASKSPTAKRSTAKASASKRSASKRSTAKRSNSNRSDTTETSSSGRADSVAERASHHLVRLTGRQAEGVVGLQRSEDGWTVEIEVIEVRRIPDTTDVLALYEIEVDGQGELLGYRRVKRYVRGTPNEE